ncbi:MAG: permease-like cell division protein FtsX, partial [Pseudomonadota bacterium]
MSAERREQKRKANRSDPWRANRWRFLGWLRDHRRVAMESFNFISARFATSFLVWLLVGIALALPAGLWILQVNMMQMSADWQGRPGLSVYFDMGAEAAQIDEAAVFLRGQTGIDSVEVTTADEALAEFKSYSGIDGQDGGLADALAVLDENPLPASLQARFARGVGLAELEALMTQSQSLPGVAEVVVEKTWLERLRELSRVVSRLGVMLGVLFGLGAVLVTASSVRLAIESRLDELRVLKMVGATQGQVRRPFLYFGGLYGFGGGVIAAMLIAITLLVIEPPLQSLLGSYQRELNLAGFDPMFLVFLLGLGSVLGIF